MTVLVILSVWQWELLAYGWAQGRGQVYIVWNSKPLTEVLADQSFPDSLKMRIETIEKAREFAIQNLGLKDTDNYTTYYDQRGEPSLWNVTACRPFAFEPKTWWFPIVGEVPYKGYFDKEKAIKLAEQLKAEGWEVRVRPVGGWSTLGWFRDPILSSMLERSEGELAELIIHELTHSTVFVKDQVTFNENLASFIGEQGARLFLRTHYGASAVQLQQYLAEDADSRRFTAYILGATQQLDSLYKTFTDEIPVAEKQKKKDAAIAKIGDTLRELPFADRRYAEAFKNGKPSNAYFMSFLRYHSYGDSLQQVLSTQFEGDLRAFIIDVKERHGR